MPETPGVSLLALQVQLETDLQQQLAHLRCGAVVPVSMGLEAAVFRSFSAALGRELAVKVAWARKSFNVNDGDVDAYRVLLQEVHMLDYARQAGLPVPEVIGLFRGERSDMLVMTYVETDASEAAPASAGRLLRMLHTVRCPPALPLLQQNEDVSVIVSTRIVSRLTHFAAITNKVVSLPTATSMQREIARYAPARSLLHMDFRASNWLVRRHEICGLIDWSNALVGDPALELLRVQAYGELSSDFWAGYGSDEAILRCPPRVRAIYELDAAVMLALVFLSEAPDRDRADRFVARTAQLADAIAQGVPNRN